jgi:dihydroorotate dehydrogenase (NAD+) catalytic subunit
MVYECANAVSIPIIGMGGVETTEDALELLLAGATMVSVGSANFYNPFATMDIIDGINAYLDRKHISDVQSIIGAVHS